jgi:adenosylcobyric acid synthase
MVQGTASSVGKSTLTAGLCRLLARRGVRVAPFKAQNMSNNAAVCADGGEIGRAQYAQALAARVEPTVDMNPILLKPQSGAAQVVIRGRAVGTQTAAEYFGPRRRDYWPVVAEALDRLRADYDLVVAEGAGSPAEINLRDRDVVNMRVALHAAPDADVVLVADIDRGGAFASLLGTLEWLTAEERRLVRGCILNRFRGDATLLHPAPRLLEERSGVPVLGVVPFIDGLGVPEEDAASLSESAATNPLVEVAVVRLPHISNFDEFGPLGLEHRVRLVYVESPAELRAPDLVILPGSKATIADLEWLRTRGLAARIQWLAGHGTPVLGICGGMQMLGLRVFDPMRVESSAEVGEGLRLLPVKTELMAGKTLRRTSGFGHPTLAGFWACLRAQAVRGYEIHVGTSVSSTQSPLLTVEHGTDGAVVGNVAGTYVHGVFEERGPREAVVRALASRRGFEWASAAEAPDPFEALANVLEASLDLSAARLPILTRFSH